MPAEGILLGLLKGSVWTGMDACLRSTSEEASLPALWLALNQAMAQAGLLYSGPLMRPARHPASLGLLAPARPCLPVLACDLRLGSVQTRCEAERRAVSKPSALPHWLARLPAHLPVSAGI